MGIVETHRKWYVTMYYLNHSSLRSLLCLLFILVFIVCHHIVARMSTFSLNVVGLMSLLTLWITYLGRCRTYQTRKKPTSHFMYGQIVRCLDYNRMDLTMDHKFLNCVVNILFHWCVHLWSIDVCISFFLLLFCLLFPFVVGFIFDSVYISYIV